VAIPPFHPGKPRPSTRGPLEGSAVIGVWQRSRLTQNGTPLGFGARATEHGRLRLAQVHQGMALPDP